MDGLVVLLSLSCMGLEGPFFSLVMYRLGASDGTANIMRPIHSESGTTEYENAYLHILLRTRPCLDKVGLFANCSVD